MFGRLKWRNINSWDVSFEAPDVGHSSAGGRKAAADFEKVIDHRGWLDWYGFAPLAQLGLAR